MYPASPNCPNATSSWLVIFLSFMQVIPRSGNRLLPAFMRTRFYFYCATLSTSNLRPSRIHAAAISAVHSVHSSLHYAPAVQSSFQSLHVHATRTPALLYHSLTVTGRHHAPFASLIRSSFRLAGAFSQSALSFAFTFGRFISFVMPSIHSSHFAAPRQQAVPIPLRFL